MKKLKNTNFLKLGILLFSISLLITNCQQDDNQYLETKSIKNPAFKISKINANKIQQNKLLSNKLQDFKLKFIESKNGIQNKNIHSSQYNFSIDTDYATYIENEQGTYHSYTFQVFRDVDNGLLENLFFSLQPDGTYKTILVAYTLTQKDKENFSKGFPLDLIDKVTYSTINYDLTSNLFSKIENCIYVSYSHCGLGNDHPEGYFSNGEECDGYEISTMRLCTDGSGGGSYAPIGYPVNSENTYNTSTNTSAGTGGTNTGATTTTNPDVTSPTGVLLSFELLIPVKVYTLFRTKLDSYFDVDF